MKYLLDRKLLQVDKLRILEYSYILMKGGRCCMRGLVALIGLLVGLLGGTLKAQTLSLKEIVPIALRNNLELQAIRQEIKAAELELKAAKGMFFPKIKLQESFTRTDLPTYAFFSKLGQERVSQYDFDPRKLNDPPGINNFQTKLSIELPIWIGGKLRAYRNMSRINLSAKRKELERKEEEVISQLYEAYMNAVLSLQALKVARQSLKDAQEHYRLAQRLSNVGMALLSDVLRAKVYVSKAQEKVKEAENNYRLAKKAVELIANADLGEFDVQEFYKCPKADVEELKRRALLQREDLKALKEYIKLYEEQRKAVISEIMPQVYAFGSYELNSRDYPLGSQGKGYMVGAGVSLSFDTGLATLNRAKGVLKKREALIKKKELLEKAIMFSIDEAYAQYINAINALKSAESRISQSEEALRVIKKRYESGLARMVDLLDIQTQLDLARFEKAKALHGCTLSYVKMLLSAGVLKEEVER